MHKTTVITNDTVCSNKKIICNWIFEHFHAQGISYDFFSLFVEIRVNQSNIVVAADAVSKGRQLFFNSDDFDWFRERVSDVSEFVVCGIVGDEQTFFISRSGSANNSGSSDGGLDDRNEGSKFAFEDRVEVIGPSSSYETISIGKFREDSNIVRILVLYSICHEIIIHLLLVFL